MFEAIQDAMQPRGATNAPPAVANTLHLLSFAAEPTEPQQQAANKQTAAAAAETSMLKAEPSTGHASQGGHS